MTTTANHAAPDGLRDDGAAMPCRDDWGARSCPIPDRDTCLPLQPILRFLTRSPRATSHRRVIVPAPLPRPAGLFGAFLYRTAELVLTPRLYPPLFCAPNATDLAVPTLSPPLPT